MVKEAVGNGVESSMKSGDPTETIRFAEFSRQVFGPDFALGGKKMKRVARKGRKGKVLRRGASGADFRQDGQMSPEKRQFNRTLKRSDANMRAAFKTMNNFEHLEKILQTKLHSKTGSGGMELLRLFRQIDKDKNMTIDLQEFEEALLRFNLNLEHEDMKRLFNHYDKTGSGGISYYEFIKHLLPGDFIPLEKLKSMGGIPGMSKRDVQRELLDAAAKRAVDNARRASVGLGSNSQVEKVLRDKIMTNLSSGPYELVRMFRMFDLDGNGEIDFSEFKEVMHKFNITIPDVQMRTLFKSYDKDGRGSISYYNFLHHVLPADFPDDGKRGADPAVTLGNDVDSRTNSVASRNPYFAKAEKRSANYVRRAFRGHGDFQELERILRGKIQEKTKSGGVELLRLFRQFDKDGNQAIDLEEFKETLRMYNLDLEDSDVKMMFNRYDQDRDGLIDYYEFIRHLLPNDFIPLEKLKSMGGLPGMTSTDHSREMLTNAARKAEHNVKAAGKGLALHNPKYVRDLFKQKVMMKTKGGARELWQAFRHFDKDGSGDIDFDEFHHVVVDHYNIDLPREEVRSMFNEFIERGKVYKQEHAHKLGAARFARKSKSKSITKKNQSKRALDVDSKMKDDDDNSGNSEETNRGAVVVDPFASSKTAWGEMDSDDPVPPNAGEHPCAPKLIRVVKKQWRAILRDLSSMDTNDTGLVSRAEARFVFGKYRVTLTDKEIIALTPKNSSPKNPALIDYRKFLASFGAPMTGINTIGKRLADERPHSTMAASAQARKTISGGVNAGTKRLVSDVRQQLAVANQKGYKRASKLGGLRPMSASWNFSGKLDKDLRKMMAKSWKQVANALRGQDTRRKKSLHGGVFRRTLSRFGVYLNDNDLKHLRHKFGTASHAASKKQLSIDYASFLKHYTSAAGTNAVTRRRPSTAGLRRSSSAFGVNSSRKKKSGSGGSVTPQEYNPSARQFETSLSAHVKKALQIANAPADRRALKAALASARSTGSITSRSRALSRGMPGGGRRSYRPGSASMQRSMRRSASSASLRVGRDGGGDARIGSSAGPVIVKTSQRNLGDTGPPPSTGRSSGRGQRYLNRRLSKQNVRSFSRSGIDSAGLMGSTTGAFGTLKLGHTPVNRNGRNSDIGGGYDSRDESESETGSLFRGRTPMLAPESQREDSDEVDPGQLRALCRRLKATIKDSWKSIRQDLKASDSYRSGTLPARTFRSVMARHDVALSEDDFYIVMRSFSRNVGGHRNVHYDSFLRMVLR